MITPKGPLGQIIVYKNLLFTWSTSNFTFYEAGAIKHEGKGMLVAANLMYNMTVFDDSN